MEGSVWLRAKGGVKPHPNVNVWGWLQLESSGQCVGPVGSGPDGRYSFAVPTGASLRVRVGAPYQPCVATVAVPGNTSRDIHIIVDQAQLGPHLPSELLDDTPTLAGIVFETTALGRQPMPDVRMELDMLGGLGDVSATTLTDSDGRYLLCGLRGVESTYVYATKSGYYKGADVGTVHPSGNTIRDIELGR